MASFAARFDARFVSGAGRELWEWLLKHAVGRRNAKTAAIIAAALGFSAEANYREVRRAVRELAMAGAPIVASAAQGDRGYHVATSPHELRIHALSLRRQALAIWQRAVAAESAERLFQLALEVPVGKLGERM